MGRVLKQWQDPSKKVIPREVYDAAKEAERILSEAHAKAQAIMAEAEGVREAARKEGFLQGREEGLAQVTELILRARAIREAASNEAQRELGVLALRIAEKIIGRALILSPEIIADTVRQALEAVRHQREIIVRVHPDDLLALEQARPSLRNILERTHDFRLCADPSITRGGCMIETEAGTIDARLETQLEAIAQALLQRG